MRVLVCGGRHFSDKVWLNRSLDELHREKPITLLICGGATGADAHAEAWAKRNEIAHYVVPAKWKTGKRGNGEGPIRNQRMIDEGKPDLLVAFPGNDGTADMVNRAMNAKVEVKYR